MACNILNILTLHIQDIRNFTDFFNFVAPFSNEIANVLTLTTAMNLYPHSPESSQEAPPEEAESAEENDEKSVSRETIEDSGENTQDAESENDVEKPDKAAQEKDTVEESSEHVTPEEDAEKPRFEKIS